MEITKERMGAVIEDIKSKCRKSMKEEGRLDLMVLSVLKDGMVAAASMDYMLAQAEAAYEAGLIEIGHRIKALMWGSVRRALEIIEARGVIIVSDAWTVKSRKQVIGGDQPGMGRTDLGLMPRHDPKRQEALFIKWEIVLDGGEVWTGMWENYYSREVVPGGTDKIEFLEEVNFDESATEDGGLASGFFKKAEAKL